MTTPPRRRLLVATFGRLLSHDTQSGATEVIHEGAGKYYGLAPAADAPAAADARLAVVSRPAEKGDADRTDFLVEIDVASRKVLSRRPLPTMDTHQMIRAGDRLLVTDTERGAIDVLAWPSLRPVRRIGGFTQENHVNSLFVEGASLFAMCHNKGKSWMARIDLASGLIAERFEDVGENAHDIAPHGFSPHGSSFIVCDSKGGALLRVDRATKRAERLWSAAGCFTKGLVVEDGVAWFGVSPAATRAERAHVSCDLVAFDLSAGREIARRKIESRGLVNAIATESSLARQRIPAEVSP